MISTTLSYQSQQHRAAGSAPNTGLDSVHDEVVFNTVRHDSLFHTRDHAELRLMPMEIIVWVASDHRAKSQDTKLFKKKLILKFI